MLAAASFPKLVVAGNWHRAFNAVCDVLQDRLAAQRVVIGGFGRGVQFAGEPFNERLAAFWAGR
jgi:hypothetical protein